MLSVFMSACHIISTSAAIKTLHEASLISVQLKHAVVTFHGQQVVVGNHNYKCTIFALMLWSLPGPFIISSAVVVAREGTPQ
jgi:hypothetical protein